MASKTKEIARLRFRGERFELHALDADGLAEVQRYLRLVEQMAQALWRHDHPERERLPAGFESANRALLRKLQKGSTVAVIEARAEETAQTEFLDRGAESLIKAAEFTQSVFAALAQNRSLPERLPKELITEYAEFGKSLSGDEFVEIKARTRRQFVAYRPQFRARWSTFAQKRYEAQLEQVGEIFEADVRNGRFQIWTDRSVALPATFKPDQEAFVTAALKDHRSMRVRVAGLGEYSAGGKPVRFLEVTSLAEVKAEPLLFDPNARPIEDEIEDIWKDVPESEWSKLPTDLSENLDHYLYGTPKK